MILKMDGHQIETAYSGADALARIGEFQPAVVLLDIGLPGIDGFQVARRIRRDARNDGIQLVAITGYGQDADRARTREAGFAHHLVKPVDFADLKRLLAALA
jgi:CheY-like chemotaxis protein